MLAWFSVWSGMQTCIWPSSCHCHSLSLASVKSRLVLPFWYRLTRVVLDKGPLNVCVYINRNANKRETDANTIRCSKTWSGKLTLLATNWRMRSCPMSDLSPCLYQSRRSHSASSCYNSINMGSSSSTSASAAITAVVTMSYQPTLV